MPIKPEHFQPILKHLTGVRGLKHKQLAARSGMSEPAVQRRLDDNREMPLPEGEFRQLLDAAEARLSHAAATAVWLDTLAALDEASDLTPEERDLVELFLMEDQLARRDFALKDVRRARTLPPLDEYPKPQDVEPARWFAGVQLLMLRPLPQDERIAVVRSARKYQHWALAEAAAHASDKAASRDLEKAAAWASLAVEVAARVGGPAGWLKAVRGYVAGSGPNVLRILGEHDRAEAGLAEARRLFEAGSDPDHILDRGRLLSFEASLRRDQRLFPEALDRLREAFPLSHEPAGILINKGSILVVMGDVEQAIETLQHAKSLLGVHSEPRLWNTVDFNLAACYIDVGRHRDAAQLTEQARARAEALGDELDLIRFDWIAGRAANGLGRTFEAEALLEKALEQFRRKGLWYDVALALLELDALLLREGRTAEVKAHTPILAEIFNSKKVHREALVALKFFRQAAEKEAADERLARRVLRFLFRARHDQGLQFSS